MYNCRFEIGEADNYAIVPKEKAIADFLKIFCSTDLKNLLEKVL